METVRRAARHGRRPSLRRRLLLSLLVPMLVALVLDAILTYTVALAFANHVHDNGLADDATSLAQLIEHESPSARLTSQAQFLLEYDPDGREYFAIRSVRYGLIAGSRDLPVDTHKTHIGQAPILYSTRLGHVALRAATLAIADPQNAGDALQVTVAENLNARHRQARQILMLAVPLQVLLAIILLLLVWFGVNAGLRGLTPVTRQLARREHDLAPLNTAEIPLELSPLARTIDDLFARLRDLIGLHERFIADAAHQLRTPLAGLSLQVERALTHPTSPDLDDALTQIRGLSVRTSRTANQLLALTRAQSPEALRAHLKPLDLTQLVQRALEPHLRAAWQLGTDLGYEGPVDSVTVCGDGEAIEELIDNLVDNALHYAGHDGVTTVGVHTESGGVCLSVEDNGPGVDDALILRLGERFYRPPGSLEGGTGLGLAIVRRIAERHAAKVVFGHSGAGGLRVEIHFPLPDATS